MKAYRIQLWASWAALTFVASIFLYQAMTNETAATNHVFLPGKTSHGHYQIEMECHVCHTPAMGVRQDACIDCHAAELKLAKDTHPAKKFNDPTNADRLALIDAQNCVTCHQEHLPHLTSSMGITLPLDYCFHCHQDVGEQRPSHIGLDHQTCSTSGCHNYHDNTALYENFLLQHANESDQLDIQNVPCLASAERLTQAIAAHKSILQADADYPVDHRVESHVIEEWHVSAHAKAGVNCSSCHRSSSGSNWSDTVDYQKCADCHKRESEGFLQGRHGMRLAHGLTAMQPGMARLPMKAAALDHKLNCNTCHGDHRYDVQQAAVNSCLSCHDDQHSLAYKDSSHFQLWRAELAGNAELGSGVSCATCHLPRLDSEEGVYVEHNQNANLRPNEKMVRSVCMNCHGLEYTLNSLADRTLIDRCFDGPPAAKVKSIDMAVEWFSTKRRPPTSRQNSN